MDKEGFRHFLKEREISEEEIEQQLEIAERFDGFLKEKYPQGLGKPATAEDVGAFSAFLIKENLNTYKNFLALARYARFKRNTLWSNSSMAAKPWKACMRNLTSPSEQRGEMRFSKISPCRP